MHNIPLHPSYVATLPENTLGSKYARFLWVDGSKMIRDDATNWKTDEFQYSLKFQLLTNMSVKHLTD